MPARRVSPSSVRASIRALANPARATFVQGYFKTGPGEYGEGDRFLGLDAPQVRSIAKVARELPPKDAEKLLRSPVHEDRSVALLILSDRYKHSEEERQLIFDIYLRNTEWINNWDLVDLSAEHIVGAHLFPRGGSVLTRLAKSKLIWERRIAMLATFHFIRKGEFREPLRIAAILRNDEHDLIQKAVGWMIREIGKRDMARARSFLDLYAAELPRTMLRYAIERFPEPLRRSYLDVKRVPARSTP